MTETASGPEFSKLDETDSVLDLFKPSSGYIITPLLMYLNVIVFLAMVISGLGFFDFEAPALEKWGGNIDHRSFEGEPWRMFSSIFLHGGILHLLMNMYGLLFVGAILEGILGPLRFLIVYVCGGLVASFASAWWNSGIVGVGASGAIFGLDGLLLAILIFRREYFGQGSGQLLTSIAVFVGYNVIYGFAKTGIDNAAHLGGLGFGFLAGLIASSSLESSRSTKSYLSSALMVLLCFGIIVPGYYFFHGKIAAWHQTRLQVERNWEIADSLSSSIKDETEVEAILSTIEEGILPIWKSNQALLSGAELPPKPGAEKMRDKYLHLSEMMTERWNFALEGVRDNNEEKINSMKQKDEEIDLLLKGD